MKYELKKTKEFVRKVKNFSLMKSLLKRKEGSIEHEIDLHKGLIETYKNGILSGKLKIVYLEEGIVKKEEQIKLLIGDLKKVKNVLRLD